MSEKGDEFYWGVLCALAIVDLYHYDTLYDEIVESVGREGLIAAAEESEYDMTHLKRHIKE